jgi:predicted transcriptional regulator
MKVIDLANINAEAKKIILSYMEKKSLTLNAFSKKAGVHQSQLYLFLEGGNDKKGLHSSTLEKIGRYIKENR